MTTRIVVAALLSFLPFQNAAAQGQSLSFRPTIRHYRVDTTSVMEQLVALDYSVHAGRLKVLLSGGPLSFSDGQTRIRGWMPADLRASFAAAARDTLSFTLRAPSVPAGLDSQQVAALGSVGTATIDLESIALGTPAAVGTGGAFTRPLGKATGTLRLGVELEPKPRGTDSVYWRGVTIRAGLGLGTVTGDWRVSGEVSVTHSTADSLGGRNLFPGGGSLTLRAGAVGLLSPNSEVLSQFSGYYFRPINQTKPNQPNRLIPTGDLAGVIANFLIPTGDAIVSPSATITHESSAATLSSSNVRVNGSGWALAGSVAVDVPLIRHVSVTPEVGLVGGQVSTQVTNLLAPRLGGLLGSLPFSDPIGGWWGSVELSLSW